MIVGVEVGVEVSSTKKIFKNGYKKLKSHHLWYIIRTKVSSTIR